MQNYNPSLRPGGLLVQPFASQLPVFPDATMIAKIVTVLGNTILVPLALKDTFASIARVTPTEQTVADACTALATCSAINQKFGTIDLMLSPAQRTVVVNKNYNNLNYYPAVSIPGAKIGGISWVSQAVVFGDEMFP